MSDGEDTRLVPSNGRQPALPPADVAAIAPPRDPYVGIGLAPWTPDQQAILRRPLADDEIEVRPDDGVLYLPGVRWRMRLNDAFGVGGWGLAHHGDPKVNGNQVFAPMRLYVLGRFAAEAMGEGKWIERNPKSSFGTALESAKTDALGRCCKDMGIALELWDPRFTRKWRSENVIQIRNPDPSRFGSAPKVWVRKDDPCVAKDSPRDPPAPEAESAAPVVVTEAAKTAAKVPATGGPITPEQITMIHTLRSKVGGLTDETYRKTIAVYRKADGSRCVGEDGKGTSKALSKDQASHYIGRLEDQIHKQHMRIDERVDTTADDLEAVTGKPIDFDDAPIDAPPVNASGKKWAPKTPTLEELLETHLSDPEDPEAKGAWLEAMFGLRHVQELSDEEVKTAFALLSVFGTPEYDGREAACRAIGKIR